MAPRSKKKERIDEGERKARSIRLLPEDWEKLDKLTVGLAMRSGEVLAALLRSAYERMEQSKKNALNFRDDVLGHAASSEKAKP